MSSYTGPTQWVQLPAEELAHALLAVMIGGNSLASALIGLVGPTDFTTWTSYDQAHDECHKRLGDDDWYPAYEMWVCWFAIMRERDRLDALLPVAVDSPQG